MTIEVCPPGTFSVYSREKFHRNQHVIQIVDLLISTRNIFLKDIAILLMNCRNAGRLKKFKKPILKRWNYILPQPALVPLIRIFHHLDFIYNDINIKNLKGAIVEVYVHKRKTNEYEPEDSVHFECNIKVDGWISTKEVDVGVLKKDCSKGECFECKLGTGALDHICLKQQLENLKQIYHKSMGTLEPAVASFEDKRTVKAKVEICPDYFKELNIYGRDDFT